MTEIEENKGPTPRTWHARAIFASNLTLDKVVRFKDLKAEIKAHRNSGGTRPVRPLESWVMDMVFEEAKCHFPDLVIQKMELTPMEEK